MDNELANAWHIVMYHDVSWEEGPSVRSLATSCAPDIFASHVHALQNQGRLVSIADGMNAVKGGPLTEPLISFWFDDAFVGVRKYALPILQEAGTTAAVSFCSRFVDRSEFFWRAKLSYLNSIDGQRFLRSRLRHFGYERHMSVKQFTLDHYSTDLLAAIDEVYTKLTTDAQRKDAFRIFDDAAGLQLLKQAGWVIANHSAAHYPVSEATALEQFADQFEECEAAYRELFGESSGFWVLPFDRVAHRASELDAQVTAHAGERTVVFVGDICTSAEAVANRRLYRLAAAIDRRHHPI